MRPGTQFAISISTTNILVFNFCRHESKKKKKEKKSKKEKKKKEKKKKKRQRRDSSSSESDDDRKRFAHFSISCDLKGGKIASTFQIMA